MAHLAEYQGKTPEKWKRILKQLFSGNYMMILTEPLISEIFYQVEIRDGKSAAQSYLLKLKSMKNVHVMPDKDGDIMAFAAGSFKVKHKRHKVSLVDSYIIAAAVTEGATIYTTDPGVRDAAKQEKRCHVDYLPKEALIDDLTND